MGNFTHLPKHARFLHASSSLWDDKDKDKSSDECEPEPKDVCKTDAELVKNKDECEVKEKDECEEEKSGSGGKVLESKGRKGVIHAVIGPVIDVYFEEEVPEVLNALKVQDAPIDNLVLEVSHKLIGFFLKFKPGLRGVCSIFFYFKIFDILKFLKDLYYF